MNPIFFYAAAAFVLGLTCFDALGQGINTTPPPTLDDVLKHQPLSPDGSTMPTIRFNAIRETALTYGAQAGLSRRSFENSQRIERQSNNLDTIYNFQALLIEGNVVPPVLTETTDVFDQSADDMLRVIGKVFRVEQQARFVYSTPNWRTYLLASYDFDANVVASVSPQTDEERKLWRRGVEEGFALGVAQADAIAKENFARLQRDFIGMVLYHKMLEAGMVTRPFVAASTKAVARAEDGSMHVGEVFLRITAAPDFVAEPAKWNGVNKGVAASRLRSIANPELANKMLREAQAAGRVRDSASN